MAPLLFLIVSQMGVAEAGVYPKKLRDAAALTAKAPDGTVAVALADGSVWSGRNKLIQVGALPGPASGLHVSGGQVTAWSVARRGLCVETTVSTFGTGTQPATRRRAVAPVTAARLSSGHALLWPDQLDLVSEGGTLRTVPLPLGQPLSVGESGQTVHVDGVSGTLLVVETDTGCPVGLEDDPGLPPLARQRLREAQKVCGIPARLPRAVEDEAAAELDVRQRLAVREGNTQALAMLGGLSCAEVEAHRPGATSHLSAFSTRTDRDLVLDPSLRPSRGLQVVVTNADAALDLVPWLEGSMAPACRHPVAFVGRSDAETAVLQRRIDDAAAAGRGCAEQLRAVPPVFLDALDDERDADTSAVYLQAGSGWRGVRKGALAARMVRMDLARLDPSDPLYTLAQVSELTPSWSIDPGPAGPILADVDGSWVAGAGWDVVRGPPNAIRHERATLLGPIQRLQGRRDGRFEVVAGGQPAQVALEGSEVTWADVAADSTALLPVPAPLPTAPSVDPGPWRISGEGQLSAHTKTGTATVDLGVTIERVLNGRLSSVAVTPVGLVGMGHDGTIAWRLTEIDRWIWTDEFVVGTSPFGIHGYRLPF